MRLLYLSHCAADAPDKGEKIRAYHFLDQLTRRFAVHLVAFARNEQESAATRKQWQGRAASIHAEVLHARPALAKAALRFAVGGSITGHYYRSARLEKNIQSAPWFKQIQASLVYSAAMAQYAPAHAPVILDLCDLDSEKWFDYARLRAPSLPYAIEARRLRRIEIDAMARASRTLAMTVNEEALIQRTCPAARTAIVTNGVDFNYWQPAAHAAAPRTLVFVGQLDYFPNVDGALWFARDVLPLIRATMGDARFVIVGRNPVPELQRLAKETDGVQLVASPPDVRPFLAGACAAVAPIRLARGLQNKVLEALAMGKRVYASREVCQTFGGALPEGVVECGDARMFAAQVSQTLPEQGFTDERIRSALRAGYSWDAAGEALAEIVRQVARA